MDKEAELHSASSLKPLGFESIILTPLPRFGLYHIELKPCVRQFLYADVIFDSVQRAIKHLSFAYSLLPCLTISVPQPPYSNLFYDHSNRASIYWPH